MFDNIGYVIGVDGGGSRTRCIIADCSSNLIAKGFAGPSNPLTAGVQAAGKAIKEAIEVAVSQCDVHSFKGACFAIAGVDRPHSRETIKREIVDLDLAEKILVVTDAEAALAGATGLKVGIVVVAGTGSIAYGVNNKGEISRAGGWGWMLGDEGSGYDIGRRAMAAALRAYDGRGEKTMLVDKLKTELGLRDLSELIDLLYVTGMKTHEIAALAPLVAEAAEESDDVAARILGEAGEELGRATVAVIRRLQLRGKFTVALTGGVFQLGEILRSAFDETVRKAAPECSIKPSRFEPVIGAVLLALREVGVEVNELFLRQVEDGLQAIRM